MSQPDAVGRHRPAETSPVPEIIEDGRLECRASASRSSPLDGFRKPVNERPTDEAELVLAVRARKRGVRPLVEPLGMPDERDLPAHEHDQRQCDERPCEPCGRELPADQDERRHRHDRIPIEYLAGRAASVPHEDQLQRAPEDDADHVEQEIEEHPEDTDLRRQPT